MHRLVSGGRKIDDRKPAMDHGGAGVRGRSRRHDRQVRDMRERQVHRSPIVSIRAQDAGARGRR